MTRYETIINLGDDFMKLMAKNIIPIHILDWKVYYEAYLNEVRELEKRFSQKRQKTMAADIVADSYKISSRTMFNVIAFMEGN